MDAGGISNVEKLEYVHWLLNELIQGAEMSEDELQQAQFYVEDIRELFWDDMK